MSSLWLRVKNNFLAVIGTHMHLPALVRSKHCPTLRVTLPDQIIFYLELGSLHLAFIRKDIKTIKRQGLVHCYRW